MLDKKKTLLDMHSHQQTSDHVYFEYDPYAEEVAKPANSYRVGYYLPLVDWLDMGSPEQLTVTIEPGNAGMSVGLRDEGYRGGRIEKNEMKQPINHVQNQGIRAEVVTVSPTGHAVITQSSTEESNA